MVLQGTAGPGVLPSATMARRTAPRRRVVVGGGGTRRTIKAPSTNARDELSLDDRPLAVTPSEDGRLLVVSLPWELWIVDARTLAVQRTIPLKSARPSACEGWDGALWIGGQHLNRGNLQAASATKVGSKLGGYVDRVALIRDDLLCGVGSNGEILWDIDRQAPVHRRKSSSRARVEVVASADGRAVFSDGSSSCWVLDPAHTEGYGQLRMAATSPAQAVAPGEAIVALGTTTKGRVVLAARDGAVAWTARDLRLAGERMPAKGGEALAVAGDERWIYVLRRRGLLQRFLISQPAEVQRQQQDGGKKKKKRKGMPKPKPAEPVEALPEAQQVRLDKLASTLALLAPNPNPNASASATPIKKQLVLAGPKADGQLGRLWLADPEALAWEPLELRERELVAPPPPPDPDESSTPERPSFIATRNKPQGPKLSTINVDDIVGARVDYWLTTSVNSILDRPVEAKTQAQVDTLLPADALLLPAMVRFSEGTARPALVLWPGLTLDSEAPTPELQWLVWGDEPRGWMALETPQIRKQKWSRTAVFPLQVALACVPEGAPGRRAKLDARWNDREHFLALARECKKQLKVLW